MSVVDEFLASPSYALLEQCSKEQLIKIAEHYSISLTSDDKRLKESLFKAVGLGLVVKEVLIGPTSPVLSSASNISEQELKIREYALEECKLQVEAARISAEREKRVVQEKQLHNELEIKKLEFQHQIDMKRLENETSENERQREFQHQRDREEREFALKKLEMEFAAQGLTISPNVASAVPSQGSHPPSPVHSPARSLSPVAEVDAPVGELNGAPSSSVLVGSAESSLHVPRPAPPPSDNVNFAPVDPTLLVPSVLLPPNRPFDVSRNTRMIPHFNEHEVDRYFIQFERVAVALAWPVEMWTLLLQTALTGRAQSVYSALSSQQSADYHTVKTAILNAYELVPEAYRQRFRDLRKSDRLTFVEFAGEKERAFDRWCTSQSTQTKEQLRELVLLEEFKRCVPDDVAMYVNDRKVTTLAQAAVCADEFVLTHKSTFSSPRRASAQPPPSQQSWRNSRSYNSPPRRDSRDCFYCHESGHLISACPSLSEKTRKDAPKQRNPKGSGFVRPVGQLHGKTDPVFDPFIMKGMVSLTGREEDNVAVQMLRDTGSAQSFILASALPFSEDSYCDSDVLVQGIEMGTLKVPLHTVYVQSKLISGFVKVAVCSQLPMDNIHLLIGNELAHEKVIPLPEVVSKALEHTEVDPSLTDVFPVCVVTRAQARKSKPTDLSDTFMSLNNPVVVSSESSVKAARRSLSTAGGAESSKSFLSLPFDRELLKSEQIKDPSLAKCRATADGKGEIVHKSVAYYWESGLLMRKWTPSQSQDLGWNTAYQVVVPAKLRLHVLTLGHDHDFAGHLGVKKSYHRILRYFFWPGLKSDVVKHCRSCHRCQIVGKPNQVIPPAPLHPIPVIYEPFERIILDCVGPLPKSKAGHQFLLTIMCVATRYPEAIPLRSLKAKPIVKVLIRFFSTFGLPKVVQTDQGSNFLSCLFKQVLQQLSIEHVISSAYHPESQGALERFHQTLKSMFRTYCHSSAREWDEGLPLLLFAVRETTQESLGFSPADLIFGHTVRGPLKLLREKLGCETTTHPQKNILDYVSSFRERLHHACACAQKALSSAQSKMKTRFDRKSVPRSFQAGDKVLVLLPVMGSALQAKFSGPYDVESKLSETNYIIRTPERRRKTRLCHINMLKRYVSRQSETEAGERPVPVAFVTPAVLRYSPEEDGLTFRDVPVSSPRLQNSENLKILGTFLSHLSDSRAGDVQKLIESFPVLFSDVPSRTHVLSHDIDVGDHLPIKQHAYRVNPTKREVMRSEVQYLVDHGLAGPSSSSWSSPCILVPKPDSTFRFCTDYRKVNAVTKPDSFPLPRMEDCVDRVGSAHVVTKLDLLKGYWQVPLTPRAAEISAFVTPECFMQYSVMAFGLRNAPASFQRLMNKVLAGIQNCEVYLDDIVLHSSSWSSHLELIHTVFHRLGDASLTLNLAKCEFGKGTVTYLGKQVGQGQVRPVEAKIQAIVEFPTPKTKREVRRFLGMAGYYRSFCRNFSDVVLPLTNLLRNTTNFVWSVECEAAFRNAKALLCSSPVLAAPNFDQTFTLEVDASAMGAGAVLLQEGSDGLDHPICYFSKKFLKHQLNYSTIEKETLAMLFALQHFEVYIGSTAMPVVVHTDHNPLIFLSRMKNTNQRIMRWSLYLQGFNLDIRYKKGCENILADTLSRCYQSDVV